MDRGIPTEDDADRNASSLAGTTPSAPPRGGFRQTREISDGLPGAGRPGVEVKLLAEDDEVYVFAQSRARIDKERAMRQAGS